MNTKNLRRADTPDPQTPRAATQPLEKKLTAQDALLNLKAQLDQALSLSDKLDLGIVGIHICSAIEYLQPLTEPTLPSVPVRE